MTCNKEWVYNLLKNTFLEENCYFTDADFFSIASVISDKTLDFQSGVSKFVIIPDDKDFVIKIPFTGIEEEGYYEEFQCGECEARPWDYCMTEVLRYEEAAKTVFKRCFAECQFLGYFNGFPIYIQEKCITYEDKNWGKNTDQEKLKTSKACNYQYCANLDWLTDFRLYYGEEMLRNFLIFLEKRYWNDDLRNSNIGYINNRPVLIDYSGFMEE